MSKPDSPNGQKILNKIDHASPQNIFLRNLIVLRISLDAVSYRSILIELLSMTILILLIVQELQKTSKNEKLESKRPRMIFILLAIYISFSSVLAYNEGVNFRTLSAFQFKVLLFILVLRFAFRLSKLEIVLFRDAILRILTLSALLGVCEFLLGRRILSGSYAYIPQDRFSGLILWPNIASILYGFGICALVTSHKRTRVKLTMSLLLGLGILATNTLTGTIATIIALAWVLKSRYMYFLIISSASFLFLNTFLSDVGFFSRIQNFRIPNLESVQFERSTESYTWRLIQWQKTWRESKSDLLFGKGFGASENTIPLGGYLPHNDYLRIIYETGIFGLLLFLSAIRSVSKALKFQKLGHHFRLSISCITILLIASIAENVLGQLTVYLIFPFFVNNLKFEDEIERYPES